MHAAQRRRDAPQALLAHELVVGLRHFDPTGLWVDVIGTHVRRPQLEGPLHHQEHGFRRRRGPLQDWRIINMAHFYRAIGRVDP